ncbi:GtrA family protein [Luteipulveratus halotolerans]|uniref:GtrA/DPMS transmembrane domain-containing protein n=1 Tax=Luteipulveratus halotolerans TaxID=1631356 RepID=A0A0L6CLI3_9MICO|nr:GtrA family protein [Luteipulveratus halotolerans]KNX38666.1 hypothetical protein VV01_18370 [Luteipulveratus halotolerans]
MTTADTVARSGLSAHVIRFALVGVGSTLLSAALFVTFAHWTSHQWANALALVLSTIVNTAVNRRFTFGVQGRSGAMRLHLQSLVLLAVSWSMTAGSLWALARLAPDAGPWLATATFLGGNAVATVVRFGLLRRWLAPPETLAAEGISDPEPVVV